MEKSEYFYHAKFDHDVRSIYDGDTAKISIDLGLQVWAHGQKVRFYGIDTPELRGEEKERGIMVRDYVRSKLIGKKVVIQTYRTNAQIDRTGKYGRWLVVIWLDGINFNKHLVEEGYAREDFYGDTKPANW